MRSFIAVLGAVLSVLSVSSLGRTLPSDPNSGHINLARGFPTALGPLQVVYSKTVSEEPSNSLKEINGKSNDISYGVDYPHSYVWLTQSKTLNPTKWIRGMFLQHFPDPQPDQIGSVPASELRSADLTNNASREDYRYLYWIFAPLFGQGGKKPLQEAALYRVGNGRGYIPPPGARIPPPGWTYISGDLNEGRGTGEYLHVIAR